MDNYTIAVRLGLALLCGGIIGLERERKRKGAGLRTHILVALGSCLIMLISIYVFNTYKGDTPMDPARLSAGVITGIGFLGAGTIMRSAEHVEGLTTAAAIWLSAAIGLGIGSGFYTASVTTTIIAVIVLLFIGHIENIVEGNDKVRK